MKSATPYQPFISVVMPVFNAASTVEQAIKSILNQSYTNFEFIIINDGSTDHSYELIKKFDDKRISVFSFNTNQGIVAALNKGVAAAKGEYIARMDADDESFPERFQYQVNYMEEHPEVGVCGTWFKLHTGKIMKPYGKHQTMLYELINRSVFHHASVMIRTNVIAPDKQQLYDIKFEFTEDLALWMKLIGKTTFANVEQVLLKVRAHQGTHVRHLNTSSAHNTVLKQHHLSFLFPHLKPDEAVFLASHLNRIKPITTNKNEFVQFIQLLNKCYLVRPNPDLSLALTSAIWFKLASNAPHSFLWLPVCKKYAFASTSIWQKGWLLIKPIVLKLKSKA